MPLHLVVLDAYAAEGRAALRDAGGHEAGLLYRRMLGDLAPEAKVEVLHPADGDAGLPSDAALRDLDGVAWTGSSLTIHDENDPRVTRQIEFARRVRAAGVPSFGSCWAAQIAVVAAGGRCAPHAKGREFGVARRIVLNEAGRVHPLFAGKPPVFDAFTSHADHVVALGPGVCLASNEWSPVQAVEVPAEVPSQGASFWALQYHPEYDPHEVASLCRLRRRELVAQGSFADDAEAWRYIDDLETLHETPSDTAAAERLGLDATLLDPSVRHREAGNWLHFLEARRA